MMFHNQSRPDSATNCGTIPQGKGREGKWKGSGTERFRDVVFGSESQDRIRSNGDLGAGIGFGVGQ